MSERFSGTDIAELNQETTHLIGRMARTGIRRLARLPHSDPLHRPSGIYPDRRGYLSRSISVIEINPSSHKPPQVEGFGEDEIYVHGTTIEQSRVGKFVEWPDLHTKPALTVELGRATTAPQAGKLSDPWRRNVRFSIRASGQASPDSVFEGARRSPNRLAVAGLVAQTILNAYDLDIGVSEAEQLYGQWVESEIIPQPQNGEAYWSTLSTISVGSAIPD